MTRSLSLNRIDRYISGQLALALVLVTAGLVLLIWLTQSLRFIQIIVDHGLSPLVLIRLTLLLVPSFVATILPITCFIVVLFIYARLSGDRELTVMRAAGVSDGALARPALMVATAAVLCGYLLTLVLVPASLASFRDYEFEIRNQIAAFLLQPGVFTPVGNQLTVYVQSRGPDDTLHGILINDDRDRAAPATILARSGRLSSGPLGPVVLLENGEREQIDAKTGRLDVLTFKRDSISLAQAAKAGTPEMTDSAEASMRQLFHPAPNLDRAERAKWLVEAQRRLTAPLAAVSYTLIALFATLSGMFRRHGNWARPAGAVVTVTLLVALSLGVNNLAARNLALVPLIWAAIIAPGLVAAALLFAKRAPQ
ncbi:MAG: LPS export ABC transporter permease LptF [Acidocella sp. 20-61-6]|nr:MAG: LPS export ABC transporter permease LptF [Acidocella sp. 20-61-6]